MRYTVIDIQRKILVMVILEKQVLLIEVGLRMD